MYIEILIYFALERLQPVLISHLSDMATVSKQVQWEGQEVGLMLT